MEFVYRLSHQLSDQWQRYAPLAFEQAKNFFKLDLSLDNSKKLFVFSISMLVLVGLIMVYSSSYIYAQETFGDSAYFFKKQLLFLGISLACALVMSKTKFLFWLKYAYSVHGLIGFLVILTIIPGVGLTMKGASRWVQMGSFLIQPGEFLKYTTILASIRYFTDFHQLIPKDRLIFGSILLGPIFALIVQPDFGMFFLCLLNLLFICYLSPFRRLYFYGALLTGLLGALAIMVSAPYRVQRILSFLNPWEDPQGAGFQVIQSFLAFAHGALFGTGLGNGHEKLFYLPEAHNDFILSVIGEELGFVGIICVTTFYFLFVALGLRLTASLNHLASAIFAAGCIVAPTTQALLNMGVTMGLLPTKGLTLPFISYGGSSLLASFLLLGLFFSCLNHQQESSSA